MKISERYNKRSKSSGFKNALVEHFLEVFGIISVSPYFYQLKIGFKRQ